VKPPARKRIKPPYLNSNGYYCVRVEEVDTGKHYSMLVHRLVWEEGHEEVIPKGYVIHHKDGNKQNNALSNLQKMTRTAHRRHHKQYRERKYQVKRVQKLNRRLAIARKKRG
jgi:hypothetical protein